MRSAPALNTVIVPSRSVAMIEHSVAPRSTDSKRWDAAWAVLSARIPSLCPCSATTVIRSGSPDPLLVSLLDFARGDPFGELDDGSAARPQSACRHERSSLIRGLRELGVIRNGGVNTAVQELGRFVVRESFSAGSIEHHQGAPRRDDAEPLGDSETGAR